MLQTITFWSGRGMQQPARVPMYCLCLQESHSASWGEPAKHDLCGADLADGLYG